MTNFSYFIVQHQIWRFIIINLQKYFLPEDEKSYLLLDLSISIKFCMVMSREFANVDVYGILLFPVIYPYFKLVSVVGAVIPCVWEAVSSGWCEVVQGVGSDYIVVWGQHRVCQ